MQKKIYKKYFIIIFGANKIEIVFTLLIKIIKVSVKFFI